MLSRFCNAGSIYNHGHWRVACSRFRLTKTTVTSHHAYYYHTTAITYSEEAPAESTDEAAAKAARRAQKAAWRAAALDYNNRRAAYNRSVSKLRKEYAEQIAIEKVKAEAAAEINRQAITRQRLERQRRKNERSAANALRLEQFRKDREKEFNQHLEEQQKIREAKHERFQAARQLVIDDLEKEAPLWLTSEEEVEKAFTHDNMQLLLAYPGGILGAPNPSIDTKFWEYQTHTWHMNKTYKTHKEYLLEKIEEEAYLDANIDPKVWTPERRAEWENKQRKAKLRAMVHAAGRSSLIHRQQQILNDRHADDMAKTGVPKPKPVPSLKVLRKDKVIEEVGAQIALETPQKFFKFDQSMASGKGKPVDLRDPLRDECPTVFPVVVGRESEFDTRTEKEKKAEQKEMDKKWAAEDKTLDEDEQDELEAIDYETFEYDTDDEDFKAGRYSEKEIDWVTEQLSVKLKHYEQEFDQELDVAKQDLKDEAPDEDSLEAALIKLPADELIRLSDLDENYPSMSEAEVENAIAEFQHLNKEQIMKIMTRDRSDATEQNETS